MQITANKNLSIVTLILASLLCGGCDKHDDSSGGSSGGSASSGPISGTGDAGAVAAVKDEIAKRWLATPDGFVSEYPSHVMIATGKRADAESYYRQIKELKFEIETIEISESDKLNGVQFRGYCHLKSSPMRFYNDPNSFGGKKWSEWKGSDEATAIAAIVKKNGKWDFPTDSFLVTGAKPSESTVAQLK
jgi:hypothetical protein